MKMKLLLSAVLMVFATQLQAQFLRAAGAGNSVLRETTYTQIDGSPYYFKDWKMGAITDVNGKTTDKIMLRYDMYRDEILYLQDGKTMAVLQDFARSFSFVNVNEETNAIETILFKNGFTIDGYTKKNYFFVIYDGKVDYLKKFKTSYLEETVNNFGTNEQIKKFTHSEQEFFIAADNTATPIKNRKEILSLLGNHADAIKAFIKSNKLNVKNDNDLAKVLAKYDELSSGS